MTENYTVPENYTPDDLRAIAVSAMRDLLTVHWRPERRYEYKNRYDMPDKLFVYEPNKLYAGIPYSNAHTGMVQWMKYYDRSTGILKFPDDDMGKKLGTVCANAILWAWSTVCNSFGGGYHTFHLVPNNGYRTVGDYTIAPWVDSYKTCSTRQICEENGKEKILEAYARVKPADAFVCTPVPRGHALMAVTAPQVVRSADGSVDGEKSTVTVMDQRADLGDPEFVREEDGKQVYYTGRPEATYTFAELFDGNYIPITTPEFTGEKPYSRPEAELLGKRGSLAELIMGTLRTNYPLCNLEACLKTPDGTEKSLALAQYGTNECYRKDGSFLYMLMTQLRSEAITAALAKEEVPAGAAVTLTAQLSTGHTITLAELPAEKCLENTVPEPCRVIGAKAMPDYTIPENYTPDDLRQIAVRAMRDLLTIRWQPDRVYEYRNQWDAPDKHFHYTPGMVYAGVPYANAHTGIFQWMKYYDTETGTMSFPGDGQTWALTLGTVCANCVLWAWSIFTNSIGGKFHSFTMAPAYNFRYVGDLDIPSDIEDFRKHSTAKICQDNGKERVLESYACFRPADALISTPDGHCVMVIERPHVVRKPDGTVDPIRSTVMIQDQRPGYDDIGFRREEDGQTLQYTGRIDYVYTFEALYKLSYIGVTTEELLGIRPVAKPEVYFEGKTDSVSDLLAGTVHTNYLLCNLEAIITEADGSERRAAIAHYCKQDTGVAAACDGLTYSMEKLAGLEETLKTAGAGATLRLEAQIANGDLYVLAQIPVRL